MAKRRSAKKKTRSLNQIRSAIDKSNEKMDERNQIDKDKLLASIRAMERKIVDSTSRLRTTDSGLLEGPRVNLKLAQKVHQDMVSIFENEFGKTYRSVVRGYDDAAGWVLDNFNDLDVAAKFTKADRTMIAQLQNQAVLEFAALSGEMQTRLSNTLYNTVAAGGSYSDLVSEISGALVGREDVRGRPLSSYADVYARDVMRNFYNSVQLEKGRQAGLTHMMYVGNVMGTTRDFCRARVDNVYSVDEINSWTHNWSGKRGPALTYRGGWNCRHHWQPVDPEWFPEDALIRSEDGSGQIIGIKPKQLREIPPSEGRSWKDFDSKDQAKIKSIDNKFRKGHDIKNTSRVKWYRDNLNNAEKRMFTEAWEAEGFTVPEILRPGGSAIIPKAKKLVKPKVVKPIGGKDTAILQAEFLEAERKYNLKKTPTNRKNMVQAKVRLVDTYDYETTRYEKGVLVENMSVGKSSYTKAELNMYVNGVDHIPYNMLSDMAESGVQIRKVGTTGRAYFNPHTKEVVLYVNDTSRSVAHEVGHALDDYLGGGQGFGMWVDSDYVTAADGANYRTWFRKQVIPGKKGKFYNGDGEYYMGKFIKNYEARIYNNVAGVHPQFFSVACERYNIGYRRFQTDEFDYEIKVLNRFIRKDMDLIASGVKGERKNRALYNIRKNQEAIQDMMPAGKSYEDAKWDWAFSNRTWQQQKEFYPEYADWMDDFFRKAQGVSDPIAIKANHTGKMATQQIINEVNAVNVLELGV